MSKAELYRCGLRESWQRQIGELPPRAFAHRIGGCQDFIRRVEKHAELDGHSGCVNTVHFNPSGDILVSGSDDTQIVFWDWAAKTERFSFASGHVNNVFQARIMPFSDDRSVVTCGADGQVRHSLISESGFVQTIQLVEHNGRAHKLAIEPGSPRTFYSCGEDASVYHFDLRENRCSRILICNGLSFNGVVRLNTIAINPRNPNYYAVGGSDEFARVYDIRQVLTRNTTHIHRGDDSPVSVFCPKHLLGNELVHITCVAYSQQEELLVTYNDELIYLFDNEMRIGPETIQMQKKSRKRRASRASGPPEGEEPAKSSQEEEGGDEEKPQPVVYKGHRNSQTVKGVSFFGPNDEYVVSGSDCGHIFIWKKRGAELVSLLKGDAQIVNCIEPHPFITVLATSGLDHTVKIWTPTAPEMSPLPGESAKKIMERNQQSRERKASPNLVLLNFLRRMSSSRSSPFLSRRQPGEGEEGEGGGAAADDEDGDEQEDRHPEIVFDELGGSSDSDGEEDDDEDSDEGENSECRIS